MVEALQHRRDCPWASCVVPGVEALQRHLPDTMARRGSLAKANASRTFLHGKQADEPLQSLVQRIVNNTAKAREGGEHWPRGHIAREGRCSFCLSAKQA